METSNSPKIMISSSKEDNLEDFVELKASVDVIDLLSIEV